MIILTPHTARTLAFCAALLLGAAPAGAQPGTASHPATEESPRVVRRQPLSDARAALRTRDRAAALLLTDSTVVLQLTTAGLRRVENDVSGDPSAGGRVLARMLGAGVGRLLDHGLAYPLAALREARVRDGRLVLLDHQGNPVFSTVEMNGSFVLDEFAPAEARAFSTAVNRAIARYASRRAAVRR
jgi:hypothetical protein